MSQVILQNKIQKDESTLSSLISRTITSITIPNGITYIGDNAFYKCTSLTNVVIPSNIQRIGAWCFGRCSSLTNITIQNGVTYIDTGAFAECSSLESITIPESCAYIVGQVFEKCRLLASVTVQSVTPPTFWSNSFNDTSQNLVIYVPAESVDTYKAASGWSDYAARIQAIPS